MFYFLSELVETPQPLLAGIILEDLDLYNLPKEFVCKNICCVKLTCGVGRGCLFGYQQSL
jgi:hypothetical protein